MYLSLYIYIYIYIYTHMGIGALAGRATFWTCIEPDKVNTCNAIL